MSAVEGWRLHRLFEMSQEEIDSGIPRRVLFNQVNSSGR